MYVFFFAKQSFIMIIMIRILPCFVIVVITEWKIS